jgi:enoyl-CoA hydratase
MISQIFKSASLATKSLTSLTKNPFGALQTLEYLKYEVVDDKKVAVVTLNRPKALNALCNGLISELNATLEKLD